MFVFFHTTRNVTTTNALMIIVAAAMFSRYQLLKNASTTAFTPCPMISDMRGITMSGYFEIFFHAINGVDKTIIAKTPPNDKKTKSLAVYEVPCLVHKY
jgi:hypothetical protein